MRLVGQVFVNIIPLNSLMNRGVHNDCVPVGGIQKRIKRIQSEWIVVHWEVCMSSDVGASHPDPHSTDFKV